MGQGRHTEVLTKRAVRRVGTAIAVACIGLGVVGMPITAAATTSPITPFAVTAQPVVWPATASDGSPQTAPITVDKAELGPADSLPPGVHLGRGQTYFYVALHPSHAFGSDPQTPIVMPETAATLTITSGTTTSSNAVSGIAVPVNSLAIDAAWYFPVHGMVTSVTLQVAPFTKVLGNERGDFGPWTFTPTPITLDAAPFAGAPADTHTSGGLAPAGSAASAGPVRRATSPSGAPVGVLIGVGAVSLLVLGAVAAGSVSFRRRRAFARADRDGRVVLSGPPALVAGSMAGAGLAGVGGQPGQPRIVVQLLGPLEVDGTSRAVIAGPLQELIVFLALNPGRTFTSVQIRESIWGLGRRPITSNTFRKYLVQFRKAFGTGVLVTDAYRYELTDSVTSDWDLFRAHLDSHDTIGPKSEAADDLSGPEGALGLVRGPVLHGSFDGKKNSPFSWAIGTVHEIEDEVTTVSVDLALSWLDIGDPQRASVAIGQGLRCADANLRLRMVDLQVGAALGGSREVGRRLAAGRAAMATFPKDVVLLEGRARTFGWASAVSD